MTTGQDLKRQLGFKDTQYVAFTRLLGFYVPVLLLLYDSRKPLIPITSYDFKRAKYLSIMRAPFDKQISMTPFLSLDLFNGPLNIFTIFCFDISARFGNSTLQPEKESINTEKPLYEWLTFQNLNTKDAISSVTTRSRNLRNQLIKPENFTAKLTDCEYNHTKDWVTFEFTTTATIPEYPKNYIFNKTDSSDKFALIQNPDKKYNVYIRILDFMKWLKGARPDRLDNEPITWKEIKDVLDVAYVQVHCTCPSDWWQGINYNRTQLDGSIFPCDIKPKVWNAKHLHNEEGFLCKHAYGIIRSIAFFENQMTSKLNKILKDQGII